MLNLHVCMMARDNFMKIKRWPRSTHSVRVRDQLLMESTNHVARGVVKISAEDISAREDFDMMLRMNKTDCGFRVNCEETSVKGQVRKDK